MNKTWMKLTSMALAATLLFSGCAKKDDETTKATQDDNTTVVEEVVEEKDYSPYKAYEEPINITGVLSYSAPNDDTVPSDTTAENFSFIREAKKVLNIDFTWLWTAPSEQYSQKFGIAMASGELPDVMKVNRIDYEILLENGQLADLTEVLNYASDEFKEILYKDQSVIDTVTKEGKVYAIPQYWDPRRDTNMMIIRKDWLDELGLEIPKTTEELEDVMRAFVEKKGALTGVAMNKNVESWGYDIDSVLNTYGSYPYAWIKKDDKLVPGEIQEETKEGLAFLNKLYEDGLIVKDFATMDAGKMAEMLTAGEAGIVFGQWWNFEWPLNSSFEKNPGIQWVTAPIPSKDDRGKTLMNKVKVDHYYVVNANCKNPEAVIKLFNLYVGGDEIGRGEREAFLPENGYVWEWVPTRFFDPADIETVYTDINEQLAKDPTATDKEPEGLDPNNMPMWENMEDYVKYQNGEIPYDKKFGNIQARVDEKYGWGTTRKIVEEGLVTLNEFYGGTTTTMKDKKATLKKLTEETFLKIIMGELAIDEFDTYRENWLKLGGEKIIEEVNEWYSKQ